MAGHTAGCGCQEVLLLAKWCLTSEVSNPTTGTVRNEGRGTVPSSLHSAQLTHRVPAQAMLGATCGMRERATPRCLLDGAEHQGIYSRFCILTCGEWGRLTGCYQKVFTSTLQRCSYRSACRVNELRLRLLKTVWQQTHLN